MSRINYFVICVLLARAFSYVRAGTEWRLPTNSAVLENSALKAYVQSGFLCRLDDKHSGRPIVLNDPTKLAAQLPVFGAEHSVDLDSARVRQNVTGNSITTNWEFGDGSQLEVKWTIEPGSGDLIINATAHPAKPMDELRLFFPGFDISDHALVWVSGYGAGHTASAPWNEYFLGDPMKDGSPSGFPHPLVALFQGKDSGFVIEGREPRTGPACLMAKGQGDRATLGMDRRFAEPQAQLSMYEIRIRTYQNRWESAIDPYVRWLEGEAGYVAIDKLPAKQAWIAKLKTQAYIPVGDYKDLEALAKRVKPSETFVGRQGEFLRHGFDVGYPDYGLTDDSIKWCKRARELGFHVGMHFNSKSVSAMFPELVKRFQPGFAVVGKDASGNDVYETIYEGQNKLYRVGAGLKDWRDYLIDQMHYAVDAGVDVIYLDEAMSPAGKFLVDGVDGYQGLLLLMKEIQERYPHVAVETEQFNALTSKYGKLALSQMPLGHPLAGYIYQKFVKVVPEGIMYSPTSTQLMDAFDIWGFMVVGADTFREESWLQIAEAVHKYDLVPDAKMPRVQVTKFVDHWTHGVVPVTKQPIGDEVQKLFGFKGSGDVTAYLEKHATKRGLVLYEPNKSPAWIGTRYFAIRSYPGPGVPSYFGFRQQIKDWLIYDGDTILGLDPSETYWFDTSVKPSPTRFHLFKVPENFAGVYDMETRTAPQEFIQNDAFFYLNFSGKGQVGAYVPDDYEAYLNGEKINVDPNSHRATGQIDNGAIVEGGLGYHIELAKDNERKETPKAKPPGQIIAFRKTDTALDGPWVKLPWLGSIDNAKWVTGDGSNGFRMNVGAIGRIIGKVPTAKSVRINGSFTNVEGGTGSPGDGVIRINGKELLRFPHGEKPYKPAQIDLDISKYMGQNVIVEFIAVGSVRAAAVEWSDPRFEVTR